MSRSRIAALTAATTLLVGGAFAANAGAAFHLIKVSEVHTEAGVNNDYIELQMYADGQNFVAGHHLRLFDGAGVVQGDYNVPTNLANGQSQRTFTIGNTLLQDYNYGGAGIAPAGGAVCWNENGAAPFGGLDCVSWGNYTPGVEVLSSPAGTNAPAITEGQSLQRKLTPGCVTLLEAADDTNNSAADFVVGAPTPRNNNVAPTEKPCTTPAKKKKCKKKKGKGKAAAAKKKCKKKKKK